MLFQKQGAKICQDRSSVDHDRQTYVDERNRKCECDLCRLLFGSVRRLATFESKQRLSGTLTSSNQKSITFFLLLMKVICAGFLKTGTKSIAKALRYLGFTVFDWEEQTFDFVDWVDVFQNGTSREFIRKPMHALISLDSSSSRKYWKLFLTVK